MDHPFQSPAIISFCPGILGLERGLERAIGELRVLAYCEIEAVICENLVAGMESGLLAPALIWTDAKTFPAQLFPGFVDWIIGGYPCPPFSYAGKRKGEEDPRHLWPYLRNHGETIKPRCGFFFENVAGHLSLGFDQVYKELVEMGYSVEAGIFTAEEVGAPHQRERLFILALANSYLDGYRTGAGGASEESGQAEKKAQWKEWDNLLRQRMWNEFGISCASMVNASIFPQRKQADETIPQPDAGKARAKFCFRCIQELAYPIGSGFQAEWVHGISPEKNHTRTFNTDRWPSKPGEQQYDWEEPRTIESGLGCTINGYNFREDLLRALGNSVVEQTAELAFITLLLKHLKNLEP